jgi:enoyl-CoA hydratase/carnithine racemase
MTTRIRGADLAPQHFQWRVDGKVATITLDRPERKNPLTFGAYAELRDTFRQLAFATDIKVVVITGAAGNFSSGGDVHEIIGSLVALQREGKVNELLAFTRMTGDVVRAMRACPQPVIAAVDGVCAGAGAILAMASDIRIGTSRARVAFLFTRVGLSGADMGACAVLPRIIGHGRAAELLYSGRFMSSDEAEKWGFFTKVTSPEALEDEVRSLSRSLASGPTFAHAMTKRALHQEWAMALDEAIESEAQVQAMCMETEDFARAYEAFARKQSPVFEGN